MCAGAVASGDQQLSVLKLSCQRDGLGIPAFRQQGSSGVGRKQLWRLLWKMCAGARKRQVSVVEQTLSVVERTLASGDQRVSVPDKKQLWRPPRRLDRHRSAKRPASAESRSTSLLRAEVLQRTSLSSREVLQREVLRTEALRMHPPRTAVVLRTEPPRMQPQGTAVVLRTEALPMQPPRTAVAVNREALRMQTPRTSLAPEV